MSEFLVVEMQMKNTGYDIPIAGISTVVRADTARDAVQVMMSATGRIGKYAVIECEWTSFSPFQTTVSEDGLLVAESSQPKLNGGGEHGAANTPAA